MPEIGQTISHFKIVEKLGSGGMGVVYRARDTRLDRFVAIKVLPAEKVADPERKRRFVQEAKAASALNHPNIVHIYDIDQSDGTDFIAMEYVEGKTLDQGIGHRGLRLNDALKYAVQIADALAKAHSAGIIHRDLKPTNIMVNEDGVVKVLDFGLAKLTGQVQADESASTVAVDAEGRPITEEGVIVGTVAYMSPEQAEGKKVDARSDIFSLGSVLYEMVTGQKAFQGTSKMSTLSAILHQEPKPVSGIAPAISGDLEKLINRCLRKDPARRFQHMDDLKIALDELKEESDSGRLAATAPPVKRNRRRLLAALLALPLLVAAGWQFLKYAGHNSKPPALVQLTSYPGSEQYPCFSPDGQQVAFAWDGEREDNYDIYVKLVGETNALRLTTDAAPEEWPAWSPDGKRIAFKRSEPGAPGIWLVSPLGGAEQKLADVQTLGQMSWSPDGKWLAVTRGFTPDNVGDVRGIFLVPVDGGEPRRLSDPKEPAFDIHPGFSPDGRLLAYASCASTYSCDVFVQQLDSSYNPREPPRRITRQGLYVSGIAWSRDGRSLIYSGSLSWGVIHRLWRVGSSGGQPPEQLELAAGFQALYPSVTLAGDRLAFYVIASNYDIWRCPLGGVPEPFLRSSLHDYSPQYSPDGSRIAFASGRSGDVMEIWIAGADGSRPFQLTRGPGRGQGTPRWSPDGRLIAFDSLGEDGISHIYVIDANGGRARRVGSGMSTEGAPSWSRDGKWIYFYSNRTGRKEVWRASLGEGAAQQVTDNGGDAAFESTDGRTLFYTRSIASPLFARPLDGGPERQVLDHVVMRAFAVFADGIYYIGRPGADNQYPIQFHNFSTGANSLAARVERPLQQGLSVSPDRKIILFSKSATSGSDLMLVENFR
jgi:eukaryotic-like serine/threonine-protein kinase